MVFTPEILIKMLKRNQHRGISSKASSLFLVQWSNYTIMYIETYSQIIIWKLWSKLKACKLGIFLQTTQFHNYTRVPQRAC